MAGPVAPTRSHPRRGDHRGRRACDDCFARPGVTELAIESATSGSPIDQPASRGSDWLDSGLAPGVPAAWSARRMDRAGRSELDEGEGVAAGLLSVGLVIRSDDRGDDWRWTFRRLPRAMGVVIRSVRIWLGPDPGREQRRPPLPRWRLRGRERLGQRRAGQPPVGPLDADTTGMRWCGHLWSPWLPLVPEAMVAIPEREGLHRIQGRKENIVYVGEGALRAPLCAHAAELTTPAPPGRVLNKAAPFDSRPSRALGCATSASTLRQTSSQHGSSPPGTHQPPSSSAELDLRCHLDRPSDHRGPPGVSQQSGCAFSPAQSPKRSLANGWRG